MIDLSLAVLLSLALRGWIFGVLFGLLYDALRLFRLLFGADKPFSAAKIPAVLFTFFSDFLLVLSCGVVGILLIWSSDGVFRGMVFAWMGLGFLLYWLTLGRVMRKVAAGVAKFFRRLMKKLIRLMLFPLKQILSLLISLYHLTIGRFLGKMKGIKKARRERQGRKAPPACLPQGESGKEEFVYVTSNAGYRREGRISFGKRQ